MKHNHENLLDAHAMSVAFYNTENFFDTIDNKRVGDNLFLPFAPKKWSEKRYHRKVLNISKVISNIQNLPIFIGLAEIENKWILKDLINTKYLREGNYDFIHYDSDDERGIDVCCLYRKDYFVPAYSENINIRFDFDKEDTTRDILYLQGYLKNQDLFHIFVTHFPSRGKGVKETEPKRITVAKKIRQRVNSILEKEKNAKILIMGDFNDYPQDISITEYLLATEKIEKDSNNLLNLASSLEKKGKGSFKHQGHWGMLDQIMISNGLAYSKNGYKVQNNKMHIFDPEWLTIKHRKLGKMPNKTYSGTKYHGGYSDHLPVYLILE